MNDGEFAVYDHNGKRGADQGKPYPWQELMELARRCRDERLKTLDEEDLQRADIEQEYEDAIDRILVALELA